MRKMVLCLEVGFSGMDTTHNYLVPDDMSQKDLDDYAWDAACQHAESYGYYPPHDDAEEYDEDISEGIEGFWREPRDWELEELFFPL